MLLSPGARASLFMRRAFEMLGQQSLFDRAVTAVVRILCRRVDAG